METNLTKKKKNKEKENGNQKTQCYSVYQYLIRNQKRIHSEATRTK